MPEISFFIEFGLPLSFFSLFFNYDEDSFTLTLFIEQLVHVCYLISMEIKSLVLLLGKMLVALLR